jgi:hypothetical protein
VQLVFHGTSEANIEPIMSEGLDPRKRAGQAQGSGEYFGANFATSLAFCKGGKRMLVFANLLDPSGITSNQQIEERRMEVGSPSPRPAADCTPPSPGAIPAPTPSPSARLHPRRQVAVQLPEEEASDRACQRACSGLLLRGSVPYILACCLNSTIHPAGPIYDTGGGLGLCWQVAPEALAGSGVAAIQPRAPSMHKQGVVVVHKVEHQLPLFVIDFEHLDPAQRPWG